MSVVTWHGHRVRPRRRERNGRVEGRAGRRSTARRACRSSRTAAPGCDGGGRAGIGRLLVQGQRAVEARDCRAGAGASRESPASRGRRRRSGACARRGRTSAASSCSSPGSLKSRMSSPVRFRIVPAARRAARCAAPSSCRRPIPRPRSRRAASRSRTHSRRGPCRRSGDRPQPQPVLEARDGRALDASRHAAEPVHGQVALVDLDRLQIGRGRRRHHAAHAEHLQRHRVEDPVGGDRRRDGHAAQPCAGIQGDRGRRRNLGDAPARAATLAPAAASCSEPSVARTCSSAR